MLSTVWRPFDLSEPWRQSSLRDEDPDKLDLQLQPLDSLAIDLKSSLLSIPDLLDAHDDTAVVPARTIEETAAQPEPSPVPFESDYWDQNFNEPPTVRTSTLLAWDTFATEGHASLDKSLYTSDLPSIDFSALSQRLQPHIGVLPQDAALRALCNLSLGRASIFYQWDDDSLTFVPTLKHVAFQSLSAGITSSIEANSLKHGTVFRRLRQDSSKQSSPVRGALQVALLRILDSLESWIAEQIATVSTLAQFDGMISRSLPILAVCWQLNGLVKEQASDETLATLVALVKEKSDTLDLNANWCAEVLQIVSQPWQSQVLSQIGLVDGQPHDYKFSSNSNGILTSDDQKLLETIEVERAILQQHVPDHPLSLASVESLTMGEIDQINAKAAQLELDLHACVTRFRAGRQERSPTHTTGDSTVPWEAFDIEVSALTPIQGHGFSGALELAVLQAVDDTVLDSKYTLSAAYDPACIRPYLQVQGRLVHRAILQLLFEQHQLQEVVRLHRSTFMFCDADFTQRLREALFEDATETSTVNLRGPQRGLRLNATTPVKWPPSSSDLSLNLLGILDTNVAIHTGFSFAVRELAEDEIERVCNALSIHALDFIRLQYDAASPLSNVFTPEAEAWYDEIFSTLLLHTRMLHLTTALHNTVRRQYPVSRGRAGGIRHIHRLVSTLAGHATQIAVQKPWSQFERVVRSGHRLCTPTPGDSAEVETYSLDQLRSAHMQYLERIRRYLFIGRRYAGIRTAYLEVYSWILEHKSTLQSEESVTIEERLTTEVQLHLDKLARIEDEASEEEADLLATLLASMQ